MHLSTRPRGEVNSWSLDAHACPHMRPMSSGACCVRVRGGAGLAWHSPSTADTWLVTRLTTLMPSKEGYLGALSEGRSQKAG